MDGYAIDGRGAPATDGAPPAALEALVAFAASSRRLLVLTGAGCSTASGIPGYRDHAGEWQVRRPVQYQDFVGDAGARARYWARSVVGWPVIARAQPNAAHRALAALEARGRVHQVLTQNVDGLHQKAGSRCVLDLHGRLDVVVCMGCNGRFSRAMVQRALLQMNPHYARHRAPQAPDGDAELDDAQLRGFRVPDCSACGGVLKPDVVFFGESVPRGRVALALERLAECDALLVVGSSLMVWSGYRFVCAAAQSGTPVALVNLGRTRADAQVSLKIAAGCEQVLAALARAMDGESP